MKTKVTIFERVNRKTDLSITIENERVEQVREFLYLLSRLTRNGKHEDDIERRVEAGNKMNGSSLVLTETCRKGYG